MENQNDEVPPLSAPLAVVAEVAHPPAAPPLVGAATEDVLPAPGSVAKVDHPPLVAAAAEDVLDDISDEVESRVYVPNFQLTHDYANIAQVTVPIFLRPNQEIDDVTMMEFRDDLLAQDAVLQVDLNAVARVVMDVEPSVVEPVMEDARRLPDLPYREQRYSTVFADVFVETLKDRIKNIADAEQEFEDHFKNID